MGEEDQDTVREMLGRHCAASGVNAFACDIDCAPIIPPSAGR